MAGSAGGDRVVMGYRILERLGKGGQGKVFRAVALAGGSAVAIKFVRRETLEASRVPRLARELEALKRLSEHPHVNRLLEAHLDVVLPHKAKPGPGTRCVMLVLALCAGGELSHYVATRPFSEAVARRYWLQLLEAMYFMHSSGVAHRDLKCDNLLLDEAYELKVADFGLCMVTDNVFAVLLTSTVGTKRNGYMPYEVASRTLYRGEPVDVWAAGVILFILLAGFPPFNWARPGDWWWDQLYMGACDNFWLAHERHFPFPPTPSLKDLFRCLFQIDPSKRMTVEQALRHPWTQGPVADVDTMQADMYSRHLAICAQRGLPAPPPPLVVHGGRGEQVATCTVAGGVGDGAPALGGAMDSTTTTMAGSPAVGGLAPYMMSDISETMEVALAAHAAVPDGMGADHGAGGAVAVPAHAPPTACGGAGARAGGAIPGLTTGSLVLDDSDVDSIIANQHLFQRTAFRSASSGSRISIRGAGASTLDHHPVGGGDLPSNRPSMAAFLRGDVSAVATVPPDPTPLATRDDSAGEDGSAAFSFPPLPPHLPSPARLTTACLRTTASPPTIIAFLQSAVAAAGAMPIPFTYATHTGQRHGKLRVAAPDATFTATVHVYQVDAARVSRRGATGNGGARDSGEGGDVRHYFVDWVKDMGDTMASNAAYEAVRNHAAIATLIDTDATIVPAPLAAVGRVAHGSVDGVADSTTGADGARDIPRPTAPGSDGRDGKGDEKEEEEGDVPLPAAMLDLNRTVTDSLRLL